MIDILQYEFMRNALISAFLASIACGIIGTYVVIKKIVFIGDGISHAAFGGVGAGYLLGINPVLSAIPFSIAAALGLGTLSRKTNISEDAAIGVMLTGGMALGVIFIGLAPGYAPDLFSYLFGNILTVPAFDLQVMAALDAVIIITVYLFHKEFDFICFDEEYAKIVGVPTQKLYLLLLCLIALTVVLLIRVVGIILVMALLTIPAAISGQYTHNIRRIMLLSIVLGIAFTYSGLYLSYVYDLASGATIVLVSVFFFLLSVGVRKARLIQR
ncbi:MAG: metal ABC transporter permease [Candidatus Altiarchaeia archaeon]